MKATMRYICLIFCLVQLWTMSSLSGQALYEVHWDDATDPNFSGSGGGALTQIIDTSCSSIELSVTDTANSPLGAFNALIINPQIPGGGGDLVDLSGNMSFHVRVRSRETVTLGLLLRAGDGSSAFRTSRITEMVPGDTTSWTEITFTFDNTELAGFDSTDLRDIWFYLDPGTANFAGNEFYFDYFTIGEVPDSSLNSVCPSGGMMPTFPLYTLHYDDANDPIFSGSSAATLTQEIDETCSQLKVSVTDTANNPLGAFSALILNPQIAGGGGDLTDLSGNMSFHTRVRTKDTVTLGLLLRAGDGSSAFRTSRISETVPGDTTSWTEIVFTFDSTELGGFDSTDLRDIWFYLDPGTENFAGNEFYLDYFSIGQAPDPNLNSTCPEDSMPPMPPAGISYAIHYDRGSDPIFTGSSVATLTQAIDSACSQLFLSVTDPVNNPWSGTSPIIINPKDSAGNEITDLSGSMAFHVRVRSLDTVQLALRLRAGDGSSAFRTDRLSQTVPGDTMQWTELTYIFDASNIGGFDSTDLRDIWLHLDYGDDNFSGNRFWIDYFAIGPKPGAETHSPCSLLPPFEFPWVLHWADTLDPITTGSGAAFLTQTIDTSCSEIGISVTEPVLGPHPAFRPIILNPQDDFGNDLQDISGNLTLYARVKSLSEVEFSALLRGGGGSAGERTELISFMVPGGLEQWTELAFDFSGANLGGFDSTDLRDIFLYLNREEANFPGNGFFIDYISLGGTPDMALNSNCVTTSIEASLASELHLFPNPIRSGQPLFLSLPDVVGNEVQASLWTASGQLIHSEKVSKDFSSGRFVFNLPTTTPGFYILKVGSLAGDYFQKIIVNK